MLKDTIRHTKFKGYVKHLDGEVVAWFGSVGLTRSSIGRELGLHTIMGVTLLARICKKHKWTMADVFRMGVVDFMATLGVGDATGYAAMHVLHWRGYNVLEWLKKSGALGVYDAGKKAARRKARDRGEVVAFQKRA